MSGKDLPESRDCPMPRARAEEHGLSIGKLETAWHGEKQGIEK